MKATKQTLGRALAHWQAQQTKTRTFIPGDQEDYIRTINDRYLDLKNDGKMQAVMENLPRGACYSDRPFLKDNEDFFIVLFSDTKQEEACISLFQHLNNCYYCFEIMSQVLRDYYLRKQELQSKEGGGNDG
jgi:hypothetical protein